MRALGIPIALGCFSPMAHAQAPSLLSSCQIRIEPVDFGEYSGITRAPQLSSGRVEVRCLGRIVSPAVTLVFSTGNSGRFQERVLMNGVNRLVYNLYVDAARRIIAGDGSEGTSTLSLHESAGGLKQLRGGESGLANAIFRFYARIEGGQLVPAGEYTDQIRVTVEF